MEIEELCREIVRNDVEVKVSKMFSLPIVAGHFAILRSWRLPLLRRGIISLYLLSSATGRVYDYYFKLDTYIPVSVVLKAFETNCSF